MFEPRTLLRSTATALLFLPTCISTRAQVPTDVQVITPTEAVNMVAQYRGSIVMFHLYASWSDPCRKEFPDINQLGQQYSGQGFVLLAFSADEDPDMLTKFLGNNTVYFTPTRLRQTSGNELANAIGRLGGAYRGAVPYSAIFDQAGNLVKEWTGANNFATYSSVVKSLLGSAPTANPGHGKPEPRRFGLNFTVKGNQLFKIAQQTPTMIVLTRDGKVSQKATSDPYFLAGSNFSRERIADRKQYAEERLRSTGAINGVTIKEFREVSIDSMSGYEIVARAQDTDLKSAVLIHQTILYGENRYYLMQGFLPPVEADRYLPAFREIAASFRRH